MNTKGSLMVDLHATFLRLCSLLAAEVSEVTGRKTGAVYFDAHEDDQTFPEGDLVGLAGMTFDVDQGLVDGSVMIGMCTQTDANLFRLVKGVNLLLAATLPGERIEVYSAETESPVGWVNFTDGTRVMPVSGKASRPIQFVTVNFVTALDYRPDD